MSLQKWINEAKRAKLEYQKSLSENSGGKNQASKETDVAIKRKSEEDVVDIKRKAEDDLCKFLECSFLYV